MSKFLTIGNRVEDITNRVDWTVPFDMTALGSEHQHPVQGVNETPSCLMIIENIPGLIAVGDWEDAIDVATFEWSGQKSTQVGDNGQILSSGRVIAYDLVVTARWDNWSVEAFSKHFSGENVGEVTLVVIRNVGDTAQTAFETVLTNCRITSILEGQGSGHSGDLVRIQFAYDTVEHKYTKMGDDGTDEGQVAAGFDLNANAEKE